MRIVCLDFETANGHPGSACALGMVILEGGREEKRWYSLIRPHPDCGPFHPMNVGIHGIHPRDVENAPEFDQVFAGIRELLEGSLVVAHNASFDMGVLLKTLGMYHLEPPEFSYLCTVKLARRVWGDLENHRLNTVCAHLGYRFRHHNAAEDAGACARILTVALEETGTCSPGELMELTGIRPGLLGPGIHQPCRSLRRRPR